MHRKWSKNDERYGTRRTAGYLENSSAARRVASPPARCGRARVGGDEAAETEVLRGLENAAGQRGRRSLVFFAGESGDFAESQPASIYRGFRDHRASWRCDRLYRFRKNRTGEDLRVLALRETD